MHAPISFLFFSTPISTLKPDFYFEVLNIEHSSLNYFQINVLFSNSICFPLKLIPNIWENLTKYSSSIKHLESLTHSEWSINIMYIYGRSNKRFNEFKMNHPHYYILAQGHFQNKMIYLLHLYGTWHN